MTRKRQQHPFHHKKLQRRRQQRQTTTTKMMIIPPKGPTMYDVNGWPRNNWVMVKPSLIQNAGLGLFARMNFVKGQAICDYDGILIDEEQLHRRYPDIQDAIYVLKICTNVYIDAVAALGFGRYVNRRPGRNNARFIINMEYKTARIVASRHIVAGEEIYVSYGF